MAADATSTEESWHALPDGHELYTKIWKPATPPVALLLLLHGFSDHCNQYPILFSTLAARGIQCYGFDQRGWGRSVKNEGQKGLTGTTTTVLDDITSVLQPIFTTGESLGIPVFVMGHSMGGGEILYYSVRGPADARRKIRGYLAESPWIALHPSTEPNRLTVVAGRIVSKFLPRKKMLQKVRTEFISRDKQICKEYEEDDLCHDTGTLEGLAGALDRAFELNTGVVMPTEGSFWIGHGDDDYVTSYHASKSFYERLKVEDKEFKQYEGAYHRLHSEPGEEKTKFANDVADWILARAGKDSKDTKPRL